MAPARVLLVASREFSERVRRPGFWIASLIVPALMIGALVLPNALSRRGSGAKARIGLLDRTGGAAAGLASTILEIQDRRAAEQARRDHESGREAKPALRIEVSVTEIPPGPDPEADLDRLDREVLDGRLDAYLVVPAEAAERPVAAEYHSKNLGSIAALQLVEQAVGERLARHRLEKAGIEPSTVRRLSENPDLKSVTVPRGSAPRSVGAAVFVTILGAMLVYTMLIFYGQIVLRGVLEEKTNRVVEVIVSSIHPDELMAGKILGIGAVGMVQVGLWALVAANLSLQGIAVLDGAAVNIPASFLAAFLGYFVLGFFLYATIFAGIGAAFDSDQDAQQPAMIAIAFVVVPMFFLGHVISDPSGTMTVVLSLVPFFAPILMMMRIAVGAPPAWQVALSVVLLVGTTVLGALVAGRIYRVGVLMYGKKPTVPEIVRWIRHG